jgi:hypothetical protein
MSKPEPDGAAEERRLDALVAGARERAKAEQARAAALLDKHGDRPLVDVALRTYRRDREIGGTVVARDARPQLGCELLAGRRRPPRRQYGS